MPLASLGLMPPTMALAGLPLTGGASTPPVTPSGPCAAALVGNLLPHANAALRAPARGAYVGEGLPPVPPRLVEKIVRREFVDMGELLPEFVDDGDRKEARTRRSRQVTDIFTWLQCFGSYVSSKPHLIPELMAYMGTIIRVSQDYAGLAWVRYDAAFRRQAALTYNDHWSTINTTIYTMCFTGMTSATKRCKLCFASSHSERECAQRGDPDPDLADRLRNLEAAVVAIARPRQPPGPPTVG